MTRIESLGAWPARVLWVVLALVSASTIGDAFEGRSRAVVDVAASGLALGWAGGLVALLVPRSTSLTALRVLAPAGVLAMVAAVLAGGQAEAIDVVTVAIAALAAVAALAPWVAEAWVDGSAYGPEERTPLRAPPVLTLAVAPLTWALVIAGATAGPLLLGARRWVPGVTVLVVGWFVAAAGVRSLHQLARRWVVVVPAGLVVHDPLTMPEPQLFLRASIRHLGPAVVGPQSLVDPTTGEVGDEAVTEDLTAGAAGLALELVTDQEVELLVRTGRRTTATRPVGRILFTPTRPLTVLDAARARRIPVS